jgi:hypothetical protein
MTTAGKALSKALESPNDWAMSNFGHTITHTPSGCTFWISNGSFFFDGYDEDSGTPKCLGYFERHWLHFKARKIISALRPDANKNVAAKFAKAAK